jgi:lipopolysaccharide/colanic/teichoic acid biosynthesis glycosyltransferase
MMRSKRDFLSWKLVIIALTASLQLFYSLRLLRAISLAPIYGQGVSRRMLPEFKFRLYLILKRWLDIICAATLLLLFSPLMLTIAVLIRLDSSGPALFAQERVGSTVRGKGGKRSWQTRPFTLYKFRTMYQNSDSGRHQAFVRALINKDYEMLSSLQGTEGNSSSKFKMVNDPRVTRVGRFLRKTSLDELPQLWNVLKGDMSLVGPRPAIPYEVDMYSPEHVKRLAAKPGLTGVWQITSRSSVDFDRMVELDVWYIENQSLWLDLTILARTPFIVLAGRGAV